MNTPNAYAPPKAAVADIDPAAGGLTLAGRGMRLLAWFIDGLIVAAVVYVPMIITGDLGDATAEALSTGNPFAIYGSYLTPGGLIGLLGFCVWGAITFRLVQLNGQTIAKKLFGMKVVRSDGSRASVARIFWLRNVVNAILSFVAIYFFIDHLFIFGERRQCLHDKIADTIVVNA